MLANAKAMDYFQKETGNKNFNVNIEISFAPLKRVQEMSAGIYKSVVSQDSIIQNYCPL